MAIWLTGYGRHSGEELVTLAEAHKVDLLVDVRYSPEFARDGLKSREVKQEAISRGIAYVHVRAFGNKRQKEGAIQIDNYSLGLEALRCYKEQYPSMLLFCACGRPENCHRRDLSEMLRLDGLITREAKWPPPPALPPGVKRERGSYKLLYDALAAMEDWAAKHPDRMDKERLGKLEAKRAEYALTEGEVLRETVDHDLVVEWFAAYALEWGVSEEAIASAAERLYRAKTLLYDYAGPSTSGGWHHWYRRRSKEESEELENAKEDTGSHGGNGTSERAAAGRGAFDAGTGGDVDAGAWIE